VTSFFRLSDDSDIVVIYVNHQSQENGDMDITDIRRRNLRFLVDSRFGGSQKDCGAALDRQPNMISMWLNHRPISERSARTIENALGLFRGWMDNQYFEEYRAENLAVLASKLGGRAAIAARAGVKLDALQDLDGEKGSQVARAIEAEFELPLGTLDLEDPISLRRFESDALTPNHSRIDVPQLPVTEPKRSASLPDAADDYPQASTGSPNSPMALAAGLVLTRSIPVISWNQAAMWTEETDVAAPGYANGWLPFLLEEGDKTYAVRVKDDSMTTPSGPRSYPEGSFVFIDPMRRTPLSSTRVIARLADGALVFRVFMEEGSRRWLRALNPGYPLITDDFEVLGTVTGMFVKE
jgi:SOS-response transcriptional repressor LexA